MAFNDRLDSRLFELSVADWVRQTFGVDVLYDVAERTNRFFEEASELAQAMGMSLGEAQQLIEYVWGRPVGVPWQEVGGVMTTLAALTHSFRIDMGQCANVELERIWQPDVMAKIRAKHATKPKNSPLPGVAPQEPVWSDPDTDVETSVSDDQYATQVQTNPVQLIAPELDGLADIPYAQTTPDSWDPDYRKVWQELQVARRQITQLRGFNQGLRAYAHRLRQENADLSERLSERPGVDAADLFRLLNALQGNPHEIREMQVTRGMPTLPGDPGNAIDNLVRDFNVWAEQRQSGA